MMKKISTLFVSLVIMVTGFSQGINGLFSKERFSSDVIDKLKGTKTVFFVKEKAAGVDSLKTALKDAWTLTPLIFDDIRNFEKYAIDPGYSYFVIEGLRTTRQSGSTSTSFFITLRLFDKVGRRNQVNTKGLATIELYPNFQTIRMSFSGEQDELVNKIYDEAVFYNWNPILLKANLKAIETNLKNGFRAGLYDETKSKDLSQLLANDTLYVPQRLLMSFSGISGKEQAHEENVFQNYRYKYRICTDAELYDIFQVQKRGRFVFEYVKSISEKLITIFDVKDGNVVYKNNVSMSYNLKAKDIERIR